MRLKPLSILIYQQNSDSSIDIASEYRKRLNNDATFKTILYPHLTSMRDREGLRQFFDRPIFFIETRQIVLSGQTIMINSKKIEQLSHELPDIAKSSYVSSLLLNEIKFSNEIEGVKTDRRELGTIVDELKFDHNVDRRLTPTVKKYVDILHRPKLKIHQLSDFRDIYDDLTAGEIPENKLPDGRYFRTKSVRIGTDYETVHKPPISEQEISHKLTTLIDFMNDKEVPPIEKAIVTHFMFENTHPFMDGNGRMGRYLLTQYLSHKLDQYTALSISNVIHENQNKYYKIFKEADKYENYAELTFFIEEMMKFIETAQENVINGMNELSQELSLYYEELKKWIGEDTQDKAIRLAILFIFTQSKLFTIDQSLAIRDTELIDRLYREDSKLFKKNKMSAIIQNYEEIGLLKLICKKPKKHEIQLNFLENNK